MQQQRFTEREKIVMLYARLAEEDPNSHNSLHYMEKKIVVDTPLHDAAAAGETRLAMEYANLMPSLARKLNRDGLSPIHLALRNGHIQTARALLTTDSELIRVKGIDGVTPLHYAAEIEETELLAEFLIACPQAIEDLTTQGETVVHIAFRNRKLQACKVLLGWIKRFNQEEILSWKNTYGDTVLHIAASTDQPEMMKLFVNDINNVNAKNFEGNTAMDICHLHNPTTRSEVAKILGRAKAKRSSDISNFSTTYTNYLTNSLSLLERRDKLLNFMDKSRANEVRNVVLIVAVLIAAATYQAVLSPPGGYWQHDSSPDPSSNATSDKKVHYAGQMIMSGSPMAIFMVTNTVAFFISVGTIVVFVVGLPSDNMMTAICISLSITYSYALFNNLPLPIAPRYKGLKMSIIPFLVLVPWFCSRYALQTAIRCRKQRSRLDPPRKRAKEFEGVFGRRWKRSLLFGCSS